MKIKIKIAIHLTATERKALKFLASEIGVHSMASCKIGRTKYWLMLLGENEFRFVSEKMETMTIGKLPELVRNSAIVEIKK